MTDDTATANGQLWNRVQTLERELTQCHVAIREAATIIGMIHFHHPSRIVKTWRALPAVVAALR